MKLKTKNLIALLLALILSVSLAIPAFAYDTGSFNSATYSGNTYPTDISGHAYEQDILTLYNYGGLAGVVNYDGQFLPNETCTENIFVRMLSNLFPNVPTQNVTQLYSGISQKTATNILTYYSATLGHEVTWDGGSPDALISRATAASFIIGMLNSNPALVGCIGQNPNSGNNNTTNPTPSSQTTFRDVSPNAYYATAVDWAVRYGITSGTSSTTFSPDQTCSIAQILVFLYRANGSPAPGRKDVCPFANIPADNYAYEAIRWANGWGLITDDTYDPTTTACTRAYLVQCLWKLAHEPSSNVSISHFRDVSPNASYATAVRWAVGRTITSGTTSNTFSPFDTITRGQAVTFIYRTYATN